MSDESKKSEKSEFSGDLYQSKEMHFGIYGREEVS